MPLNEELRYKYALDITRAFGSEEHIKRFLNFFMDEATLFANEIDKYGNQIPYPIIYSDKGFVYQTAPADLFGQATGVIRTVLK